MNILICDDEQQIIDTLTFAINYCSPDLKVDSCTSVNKFLSFLEMKKYAAVILDLNMPKLGDKRIGSVLEKIPRDTKIYIATGDMYFKPDEKYQATVIVKPFPIEKIAEVIASVGGKTFD